MNRKGCPRRCGDVPGRISLTRNAPSLPPQVRGCPVPFTTLFIPQQAALPPQVRGFYLSNLSNLSNPSERRGENRLPIFLETAAERSPLLNWKGIEKRTVPPVG